jgi:hypothetical protein
MVTVSMVVVGAILLSDGRLELQQNNTKHINKTTHNTLRHGLYSLHASYYVTRNIATTACVNITSYISFTLKYHFTVTIWVILTVQSKHTPDDIYLINFQKARSHKEHLKIGRLGGQTTQFGRQQSADSTCRAQESQVQVHGLTTC